MNPYGQQYFENQTGSYALTRERDALMKWMCRTFTRKIPGKYGGEKIDNLLEVGCAYGYFLKECENSGILKTHGIDVSEHALKEASKNCNAQLIRCDICQETTPFPDNFFDMVVSVSVIEHVSNDPIFLQEIFRLLKPGRLFVCVTPNGKTWVKNPLGIDDPTHINIHGPSYWTNAFRSAGFTSVEISGILLHGFPPFERARSMLGRFSITHPITVPGSLERLYSRMIIIGKKP